METSTKTPVDIVQELLAIHTTRQEACDKLLSIGNIENSLVQRLEADKQQSGGFISQLVNELANYGDAVKADVDRENDYQLIWKSAAGSIDVLPPGKAAEAYFLMEEKLKDTYKNILETSTGFPEPFVQMLTQQLQKLGG